jgi:hypothetical protein
MSERPPVIDIVKEEPDMRLELCRFSWLIGSLSIMDPAYLKSRIGIASSFVSD